MKQTLKRNQEEHSTKEFGPFSTDSPCYSTHQAHVHGQPLLAELGIEWPSDDI